MPLFRWPAHRSFLKTFHTVPARLSPFRLRLESAWLPALALGLCACGESTGDLEVRLNAESTIANGLIAGDGVEDVRDGWNVDFEKYLAVVGPVELSYATDAHETALAGPAFALDLAQVPDNGLKLWTFEGLRAGRWDFGFDLRGAADDVTRHKSVAKEDFERLVDEDLTYWIRGLLSKEDGRSCPPPDLAAPAGRPSVGEGWAGEPCYAALSVSFEFVVNAETAYSKCQIDGVPGVAVTASGTSSAALTIHGDHAFFGGFPQGNEGSIQRRAQWLADCDLDLDGHVTDDELAQIPWTALSEASPERYPLSGSPVPIETARDFVVAQLKTQGHYEGEGECNVDGEAHDHDHDD
jgi:hypothetical protein